MWRQSGGGLPAWKERPVPNGVVRNPVGSTIMTTKTATTHPRLLVPPSYSLARPKICALFVAGGFPHFSYHPRFPEDR